MNDVLIKTSKLSFYIFDATHRGAFGVSPLEIFWHRWVDLETRNPNGAPCFDWKGPCLEGLTFTNRVHWGWICNIYIYIHIKVHHISNLRRGLPSQPPPSYVFETRANSKVKITCGSLPTSISLGSLGYIGVFLGVITHLLTIDPNFLVQPPSRYQSPWD